MEFPSGLVERGGDMDEASEEPGLPVVSKGRETPSSRGDRLSGGITGSNRRFEEFSSSEGEVGGIWWPWEGFAFSADDWPDVGQEGSFLVGKCEEVGISGFWATFEVGLMDNKWCP